MTYASMTPEIRDILVNKEVIAVDQDQLGKAAQLLTKNGGTQVWSRPLSGDAYAVALFNRGASDASVSFQWTDLKLSGKLRVHDLWAHKDVKAGDTGFQATVPSHGVVMLRVSH